jgi:hypothetical protein
MSTRDALTRAEAMAALTRAEAMAAKVVNSKESAEITAQCGIGYALLYLADTIKENGKRKYEPPF